MTRSVKNPISCRMTVEREEAINQNSEGYLKQYFPDVIKGILWFCVFVLREIGKRELQKREREVRNLSCLVRREIRKRGTK